MSTSVRFLLPRQIHAQMVDHARAEFPNECCGALSGLFASDGICRIRRAYPLTNILASPVRYDVDPKELFGATKDARKDGWDIIGFYHSHPFCAPLPSITDRQRNWWGSEVIHFIISMQRQPVEMGGWHLTPAEAWPAKWENDQRDSV